MLKKSKVIALLAVCVMMFTVAQPALAWWGEDTLYGGVVGGATGGLCGGILAAAATTATVITTIATGGLAAVPIAGAVIGGAALTGAGYGVAGGAGVGAVIGALTDKETVNYCAKTAIVVSAVAVPVVAALPAIGVAASGTATIKAGASAIINHPVTQVFSIAGGIIEIADKAEKIAGWIHNIAKVVD